VRSHPLTASAKDPSAVFGLDDLHGVHELWSADRDFGRLRVTVNNPLIA
jgi:hypothetical protein